MGGGALSSKKVSELGIKRVSKKLRNPSRPSLRKGRGKCAFTLAEVLITLGIIGVVAALTIPSTISNFKKKEIATRFEQNYNIIQNAFQMAQVEYGDISTWDIPFNKKSMSYFNTYLFPYLKLVKKDMYTLKDLGYTTPAYDKEGNVFMPLNAKTLKAVMNNGSIIIGVKYESGTNSNKEKVVYAYYMFVDLNGSKGPNKAGRDIFEYALPLANGAKLDIGLTNWTIYADGTIVYHKQKTHSELLQSCKNPSSNSISCGALIAENGWKIPEDYPFRF